MGESDGMSSWIDPSPTFTFTIFPVGNMYQHGRCDVACGKPSGGVMDVGAPLKIDAIYPI